MYEYMRGLQRQFFKEPDFSELRQEINEIHQALAEGKPKPERRRFSSGLGDHCGTEYRATLLLRRGRRTQDGTAAEEG